MPWLLRSKSQQPPRYDYDSGHFTIKMHHGGKFGGTVGKVYIGGTVSSIDYCHVDELSLIELTTMGKELGYSEPKYFYKQKGEFMLIWEDKQILELAYGVDLKLRVLHIYAEHVDVDQVMVGTQASQIGASVVVDEDDGQDEDSDEFEVESSSSEDDLDEEFHDSDYNFSSDEKEFEAQIEKEVDGGFDGLSKNIEMDESYAKIIGKLADIDGEFDGGSSTELSSGETSSDEDGPYKRPKNKIKYKKFNEKTDMADPRFVVGMEFKTHAIFRDAIKEHGIKYGKVLKFKKNDREKVWAVCKGGKKKNCPWVIYGSYVESDQVYRVKRYVENHTCSRSYHVNWVTSDWICRKYVDRLRTNPTWPVKSLAQTIEQEWTCKVSVTKVYRAKRKALNLIEGTANEQFKLLYGYAEEIIRSNPGTRFIIKSKPVPGCDNKVKFKRLYICWGSLRKGLMEACRPVIGVDGCHLKGPHKGVLLTAVGIDANNCIYPFAYAVVGKEKRKTWQWFLELIGEDLDIQNTYGWTFMSDKQKGLIDAVADIFPNASHRFCVRHLYNNFKGEFKGLLLKDALWKCARATTVPAFKTAMEELKNLDAQAYKWLSDRPPVNWSRSHFSTFPKCDILLNNLCESFNASILLARDLPIISMLEKIRHLLVEMVLKRKEAMERCEGDICPKIYKLVEKLKGRVGEWITTYMGDSKFEVRGASGVQYKVDLRNKICGCRRWDLCGIPCIHAVAAFSLFDQDPLDEVHMWYRKHTYLNIYSNMLGPINGKTFWTTDIPTELVPPDVKRRPGRPKKARRREPEEAEQLAQDPTKLSRKGRKMKCGKCGAYGHNKRGCKKEVPAVDGEDAGTTVTQGTVGEAEMVGEQNIGPKQVPKPTRRTKLSVRRQTKGATQRKRQNKGEPVVDVGPSQCSSLTNTTPTK